MPPLVAVRGQRELIKAFRLAGKDASREIRTELKQVAEPIRVDIERLAVANIRRIGPRWYRMTTHVTGRSVYIVPKQKGVHGRGPRRRPNFVDLMDSRAMQPARDENEGRVVEAVEVALGRIGREWERL